MDGYFKMENEMNKLLDKSLDTIGNITDDINDKYQTHLRKKAIKKVDEKLLLHNIKIEDISSDDYETMISEAISEIKADYATNTAKVALSALGLDMVFGW